MAGEEMTDATREVGSFWGQWGWGFWFEIAYLDDFLNKFEIKKLKNFKV